MITRPIILDLRSKKFPYEVTKLIKCTTCGNEYFSLLQSHYPITDADFNPECSDCFAKAFHSN